MKIGLSLKQNFSKVKQRGKRAFTLSKRSIFNRRGYTVQSPFIFHFIHKTIKNKHHYYSYDELEAKYSQRLKKLKKDYGKEIISSTKTLRLIFRIVHDLRLEKIAVSSATKNEVLEAYISASYSKAQVEWTQDIDPQKYDMIIFSSLSNEKEDEYIKDLIFKASNESLKLLVLVSRKSPNIENQNLIMTKDMNISKLELNNLDLYFIGYVDTPKNYSLYFS